MGDDKFLPAFARKMALKMRPPAPPFAQELAFKVQKVSNAGITLDNAILITHNFSFTEAHARGTLRWLWRNNNENRIMGITYEDLDSYLEKTVFFSEEQMTIALELAGKRSVNPI